MVVTRRSTWTDADKLFLRENYHTLGWKAVAQELGKSGPGVRGMAGRLGIAQKKHGPKKRWSRTRFQQFWARPATVNLKVKELAGKGSKDVKDKDQKYDPEIA